MGRIAGTSNQFAKRARVVTLWAVLGVLLLPPSAPGAEAPPSADALRGALYGEETPHAPLPAPSLEGPPTPPPPWWQERPPRGESDSPMMAPPEPPRKGEGTPPAPDGTPAKGTEEAPTTEHSEEPAPPVPKGAGSLSLGYPAAGRLTGARPVALSGTHYRFLAQVSSRKTNYGTDELAGLVPRVAAAVAKAHPDAVLTVGNMSYERGGKIPWSVSHQAGRDVDLLYYQEDQKGKALTVTTFENFDGRGVGRANRNHRFAVAKNWTLVQALVMDREARVQRIFVSNGLRALLLEHARKSGAPAEAITRAESVLSQPMDSSPHADHFHVRIYCSREDFLDGCHNYDPYWPWVETYQDDLRRRVQSLTRQLADKRPAARREAIEALDRIEVTSAATAVAGRLADDDRAVREAAAAWLKRFRPSVGGEAVTKALAAATDPAWATRLLDLALELGAGTGAKLLEDIVADANRALPKLDPKRGSAAPLRVRAAKALGRSGRPASVRPLVGVLVDPDPTLRQSAAEALSWLTNQDLGGRWGKGIADAQLRKQKARWDEWLQAHGSEGFVDWARTGFERAGLKVKGKLLAPTAIPTLVKAVRRGGFLAHNAVKILHQVVGAEPGRQCGTNAACWEGWWKKSHKQYGHKRPGL